ncbi:MAG: hypothetical protein JWQ25_1030 [Daejeonella sp.]|nr:hypothetical protein [Daejeonella sp.]
MKYLFVIVLLILSSCGPESSPEGRMGMKIDALQKQLDSSGNSSNFQKQLDSLKKQNALILDSIHYLKIEVQKLKGK